MSTKNDSVPSASPQKGAPRPRKSIPEAVARKAMTPASRLSLSANIPVNPAVKAPIRARPARTAIKMEGNAANSDVIVVPKRPTTM